MHVLPLRMTRHKVAERLGKSIAAIRRLEGVLLHPTRDARGVHHFDEDHVEALAESIRRGEVSIWQELQAEIGGRSVVEPNCQQCSELEAQVDALRQQGERQRREHAREVKTLQLERELERAHLATERRELDRELRELIATIESR